MRKITITGNLGRDAETHDVNGKKVVNFSVAADSGYGKYKTTEWVKVGFWRGENLAQFLVKGQQVIVVGDVELEEYKGNKSLKIASADTVELVGGGRSVEAGAGKVVQDDVPF